MRFSRLRRDACRASGTGARRLPKSMVPVRWLRQADPEVRRRQTVKRCAIARRNRRLHGVASDSPPTTRVDEREPIAKKTSDRIHRPASGVGCRLRVKVNTDGERDSAESYRDLDGERNHPFWRRLLLVAHFTTISRRWINRDSGLANRRGRMPRAAKVKKNVANESLVMVSTGILPSAAQGGQLSDHCPTFPTR